ncbi:dynein heavy chain domain-containing protein 1 [Spea bombifrons]|uniref:dynein heavy chain domain-containing protein 1 n=1 Tax=Spea bombifrons TaxID=233779 RepID=UPI00234BB21C|nr:dynein heavy chain domain-containing protein 1 [Spea bombifrons]
MDSAPKPAKVNPRLPPLPHPVCRVKSAGKDGVTPVSPPHAQRWAHPLRCRVLEQLACSGRAAPRDVALLAAEVAQFLSAAVAGFDRRWWSELLDVLRLLRPFRDHLTSERRVLLPALGQLHRAYERHRVLLEELEIPHALRAAFPFDQSALFRLPRGGEDVCRLQLPPVYLRDLPHCLGYIGAELAGAESMWSHNRGGTALALRTRLPMELVPGDAKDQLRRSVSAFPPHPSAEEPVGRGRDIRLTGLDAAELLARYRHLGQVVFFYLNRVEAVDCCFYDLIVTSSSSVRPEHYVFSPFGVLHITPRSGAEALELGEWHREAVLCRAIRNIPFFRNFQRRRTLTRWKQNVKRILFLRKREYLSSRLIQAAPHFTAALQHIHRLLMELSRVPWLPQTQPSGYSFHDLQNALRQTRCEARSRLHKFLTLVSQILRLVRDDTYIMVQTLQRDKELTVSDRRADRKEADARMRQAESWASRLGVLTALVGHLICQNLRSFLQRDICSFVNEIIQVRREVFNNNDDDDFLPHVLFSNLYENATPMTLSPVPECIKRAAPVSPNNLSTPSAVRRVFAPSRQIDGSGKRPGAKAGSSFLRVSQDACLSLSQCGAKAGSSFLRVSQDVCLSLSQSGAKAGSSFLRVSQDLCLSLSQSRAKAGSSFLRVSQDLCLSLSQSGAKADSSFLRVSQDVCLSLSQSGAKAGSSFLRVSQDLCLSLSQSRAKAGSSFLRVSQDLCLSLSQSGAKADSSFLRVSQDVCLSLSQSGAKAGSSFLRVSQDLCLSLSQSRAKAGSSFLQVSLEFGEQDRLSLNPIGDSTQESFQRAIGSVLDSVLEVTGMFDRETSEEAPTACVQEPPRAQVLPPLPTLSEKKLRMVLPKPEVPLVRCARAGGLKIEGHMEKGENLPLHLKPLQSLLYNNDLISQAKERLQRTLEASLGELQRFCDEISWVSEVRGSLRGGKSWVLEKLHGNSAQEYEDLILKLKAWEERLLCVKETVRSQALTLSCTPIKRQIGPPLAAVIQDILHLLTSEISHRSRLLLQELSLALKVFQSPSTEIPAFTEFANKVEMYTKSVDNLQTRLDYIGSLAAVVRMNYRQPTSEEESLHCELMDTWDNFHLHLKDASDFLSSNRYSMSASLELPFRSLYREAESLVAAASSPVYLDPSQNVGRVLRELGDMRRRLHLLMAQLHELSRSRQALQGKTFDVSGIIRGEKQVQARAAAWKLLDRSMADVAGWKRTPFVKLNTELMKEKLETCAGTLQELAAILPEEDPVIQKVRQVLDDEARTLPLLQTLGSPALKRKHWKAMFIGMGETFCGLETMTIGDLLAFPLLQHQDEIEKVARGARAELMLFQRFQKLQSVWREARFHLVKFFLHVGISEPTPGSSHSPASVRLWESEEGAHRKDSGAFLLTDVESLHSLLDDSRVTLRMMNASPLTPGMQDEVSDWMQKLEAFGRHLDLWIQFQEKWVFITKATQEMGVVRFQAVDQNYRSFLAVTAQDPLVMFVLTQPQNGRHRAFHGEALASAFCKGIGIMEDIMADMSPALDSSRSLCPRLFFLGDRDLLHVLTAPAEPAERTRCALLCFPNLKNVLYKIQPLEMLSPINATLNSRQILTTGVEGLHNERLHLNSPISDNLQIISWLCELEEKMRESVRTQLDLCLSERREAGFLNVTHLESCKQWVTSYPWQCLALSEEVLWCEEMEDHLSIQHKSSLREKHNQKLEFLAQRLQDVYNSTVTCRARAAMSAWVTLAALQRDRVCSLLDEGIQRTDSFAWAKILKYRVVLGPRYAEHLDPEDGQVEIPPKTTISTLYSVDVLGYHLTYDYEYIGLGGSFIQSSLSDRTTLGLILALKRFHCGVVIGQDESSRADTVMALGHALGRQVLLLKCWAGIQLGRLSKHLQGALRGGAWLVLDSAHRLTKEVHSSLGQLLWSIQSSCQALVPCGQGPENECLQPRVIGEIQFGGKAVSVNQSYGCFMTLPHLNYSCDLPSNLRLVLRPVSLLSPDMRVTAELALLAAGFQDHKRLARKISSFFKFAQQSSSVSPTTCSSLMKDAIHKASSYLKTSALHNRTNTIGFVGDSRASIEPSSLTPSNVEEGMLLREIYASSFWSGLPSSQCSHLKDILQGVFPMLPSLEPCANSELLNSVHLDLQMAGLEAHPELSCKVLELFQALQQSPGVLLTGSPGSGKTTCWRVLSRAMNCLASATEQPAAKEESVRNTFQPVHTIHLFPNSLTTQELVGGMHDGNQKDGILSHLLHRNAEGSAALKWVIIDGSASPHWTEPISCLFGPYSGLTLPNGEGLCRPESTKFVFEMTDTSNITPAISTACAFVHCGGVDTWRAVLGAFMSKLYVRYEITLDTARLLQILSESFIPRTLRFLEQSCSSALHPHTAPSARGISEVSSFCNIQQALMDQYLPRENIPSPSLRWRGKPQEPKAAEIPKETQQAAENSEKMMERGLGLSSLDLLIPHRNHSLAQSCFLYSFVWGFAGHLNPRHRPPFDAFLRGILADSPLQVVIPQAASLFEMHPSPEEEALVLVPEMRVTQPIRKEIVLPQFQAVLAAVRSLARSGRPVLLVGPRGSGKTGLVESVTPHGVVSHRVPVSPLLDAAQLRKFLGGQQEMSPTAGQQTPHGRRVRRLFFLDDLHEASFDTDSKTYPTLEALRDIVSANQSTACVPGTSFLGTLCPPEDVGGGLCPRLTRLFFVLVLPPCSSESLLSLFTPRLTAWLKKTLPLPQAVVLGTALAKATVTLYNELIQTLPPRYLFSLRHLHRLHHSVTQLCPSPGPSLSSKPDVALPARLHTTRGIARLWMHEALLSFSDVVETEEEREAFRDILLRCARQTFCIGPQDTTPEEDQPGTRTLQGAGETEPSSGQEIKRGTTCTSRISSHSSPAPEEYLLPSHLLLNDGPLRDMTFCHAVIRGTREGTEVHVYKERQDVVSYTAQTGGLILPPEDLKHIARLTRALLLPQGHLALLAQYPATGRRTLAGLAAQLTRCLLLELRGNETREERHNLLREASWKAGVLGMGTAILVHEGVSERAQQELSCLVREGTFVGLHSAEEEERALQALQQNERGGKKNCSKKELQERFWRCVQSNLHVLQLQSAMHKPPNHMCPDHYQPWSLCSLENVAQQLLGGSQGSPVSRRPLPEVMSLIHLSAQSYCSRFCPRIALASKRAFIGFVDTYVRYLACLSAGIEREQQRLRVRSVSVSPLHVCFSGSMSVSLFHVCFSTSAPCPLRVCSVSVSPLHVCFSGSVSVSSVSVSPLHVCFSGSVSAPHPLQAALSRVHEVHEEGRKCAGDLGVVARHLHEAEKNVQQWRQRLAEVRSSRDRIREQCKALDKIKGYTAAQVSATRSRRLQELEEAQLRWAAVQDQLKPSDIEEIRRYRVPPPQVVMVTDAVCAIFGKESGWDSAKQLIGRDDFYQMLQFFDVSKMSDGAFSSLTRAVSGSMGNVSSVQQSSQAAASLCQWLLGLLQHATILRRLGAGEALLAGLEAQDIEVAEKIADKRMTAQKLQGTEAESLQNLEEARRREEELRQQLSVLQQRSEVVREHERHLEPHETKWKDALEAQHTRAISAPADALLVAAAISYLGSLPWPRFSKLLDKWWDSCRGVEVSLDPDDVREALEPSNPTGAALRVLDMLSSSAERLNWHRHGLLMGAEAQTRAVLLRAGARYSSCRPTLILDPDHRGEKWLRALLGEVEQDTGRRCEYAQNMECPAGFVHKPQLCVVNSSDSTLSHRLHAAHAKGMWVLITHVERNKSIGSLIRGLRYQDGEKKSKTETGDDITTQDEDDVIALGRDGTAALSGETPVSFHVFLSTYLPLNCLTEELGSDLIKDVNVIDMSLSPSGLEEELLREVLLFEEPRLQEKRSALHLNSLRIQEELLQAEDSLLSISACSPCPLLQNTDFLRRMSEGVETQRTLQRRLEDLESLQRQLDEGLGPYVSAAGSVRRLSSRLQEVSQLSSCYRFPAELVLRWAQNVLNSKEAIQAAKEGVKTETLVTRGVLTRVLPTLTPEHRQVLKVLLAVGQPQAVEWLAFLGLAHTLVKGPMSSCIQRPSWVEDKAWEELGHLENLPPFRGIRSSLSVQASQWQEYFRLNSTVIGPAPCLHFAHLNLVQTAILWRILCPEKLALVLTHLSSCILGSTSGDCWEEQADLLSLSDPRTPIVYLLPRLGLPGPHFHPLSQIWQLAKKRGKEVKIIWWGHPPPEFNTRATIAACQREGHWLLVYGGDSREWDLSLTHALTDMLRADVMTQNPDFRLWVVIQEEAAGSLPACVRLACWPVLCTVPTDLRSVLLQSCKDSAELLEEEPLGREALQLVILHSILQRRQEYSRSAQAETCSWGQEELSLALHVLKRLRSLCTSWEEALHFLTGAVIYGGHVVDEGDAECVTELARLCLCDNRLTSRGIANLLSAFQTHLSSGSWMCRFWRSIQNVSSLWEPSSLGLSEGLQSTALANGHQALSDLLITQDVWTRKSSSHRESVNSPTPGPQEPPEGTGGQSPRPPQQLLIQQYLELLSDVQSLYVAKKRDLDALCVAEEDHVLEAQTEAAKQDIERKAHSLEPQREKMQQDTDQKVRDLEPQREEVEQDIGQKVEDLEPQREEVEQDIDQKVRDLEPQREEVEQDISQKVQDLEPQREEVEQDISQKVQDLEPQREEVEQDIDQKVEVLEPQGEEVEQDIAQKVQDLEPQREEVEQDIDQKVQDLEPQREEVKQDIEQDGHRVNPERKGFNCNERKNLDSDQDIKESPRRRKGHLVLRFLFEEWEFLGQLLGRAAQELTLAVSACRCRTCQKVREAVSGDLVPQEWDVYPSDSHHLRDWIRRLHIRLNLLFSYLSAPSPPHISYNLSVFQQPTRLFQSLLRERAEEDQASLELYTLRLKVSHRKQSATGSEGATLVGVHLKHALWDMRRGLLQDTLSPKLCALPAVHISAARDSTASSSAQYLCPLYANDPSDGPAQPRTKALAFLSLPTCTTPTAWSLRKVCAVSLL